MADNLTQPLLIVNTKAQVAGQITPSMSQSDTASYAANQTLNQTLVLRAGQSYSPNIGFSTLVITTTAPVQLLAALGSNPTFINQTVNQQTTIDTAVDSFTLTNNGTTSATVKMTILVTPSTVTPPVGVVTSLNSMIGDLNIVAGPGIEVAAGSQAITITSTGVFTVNGMSGVVTINAANLPGLSTVAKTGLYTDLIGAPAQYVLPVATASVLGGVKVGSGLTVTQDGTLSVSGDGHDLVTSVNTRVGDVTIKAVDNGLAGSQSLISDSGATTGNIALNRLAVAGTGLAINTLNGVTTITSSGLQGAVLSVDGQHPDSNGNVVVQAVDNTGTGLSLIKSSGATTGNLTFNKIEAGSNITVTPDANGNLVLAGTVSQYTLPVATAAVLGGVKQGANVTIGGDGTISVAAPYILPVASSTVIGGVKIGANLTVALDGTLSGNAPYVLPAATTTSRGGVVVGSGLTIAGDVLSATPYVLPTATVTRLGGVKQGNGVAIAADGTISVLSSYVLPVATASVLGGVKIGSNVSVAGDGTISVAAPYLLPIASASSLGGIKVGANLNLDDDGTLWANPAYPIVPATATLLGGVKIGANVTVQTDGTISVAAPYVLPIASSTILGGVKVGANLSLAGDGTLSATTYTLPVTTTSTLGGMIVGDNLTVDSNGRVSAAAYTLPIASSTILGGIKVGANLSIAGDGTLSANASAYVLPAATTTTLGGMIVGNNLTVDANGRVSGVAAYTLPTASASVLGGVKVGAGLAIDGSGVLSSTLSAPVTSVSGQTGAVVVKAQSASPQSGSLSLVSNSGATTGTITTRDLVAGANVTIAPDVNNNLVISSASTVTSVSGQTGAVVVQASDNNSSTGLSLISNSGATTGNIKMLRIVPGANITMGPDASGNILITGATPTSPYVLPVSTASVLGGVKIGSNITVTGDGTISVATPYILPVANTTTLGGVKQGSGVTIAGDGTISVPSSPVTSVSGQVGAVTIRVTDANTASGQSLISSSGATTGNATLLRLVAGSNITLETDDNGNLQIDAASSILPVATASVLGGVKIGANVAVTGDGTISVAAPYTLPVSSASQLGGVKIGANISVDPSGVISVAAPTPGYTLPVATASVLGGVKAGSGVAIAGDGTLSVTATGVTTFNTRSGAVTLGSSDITSAGGALASDVAAAKYYDLQGGAPGILTAAQILMQHVAVRTITVPASMNGSKGYAGAVSTGAVSCQVSVLTPGGSSTNVGTINWTAGGITPTFTSAGFSVTAGQVVIVTAPATSDATFANVAFTILGLAT